MKGGGHPTPRKWEGREEQEERGIEQRVCVCITTTIGDSKYVW